MRYVHIGSIEFFVDRSERQTRNFFPLRWRIHHTHTDQDKRAHYKHQDGIVQKIHAHEPANSSRLVMPRFVQHFKYETHGAQNKSDEQGANCSLSIQSWPENSKDEAHSDGRADICLHALQINIKLRAKQVNEGHPQEPEYNHDARGDSPEVHQLNLTSIRANLLIKIKRNHRRSGIED